MSTRRSAIESLSLELKRLSIVSANIRRTIAQLEGEVRSGEDQVVGPAATISSSQQEDEIFDRDGNIITIGCEVIFLTRGRFKTTRGTVTHFSDNKSRVFAIDKKSTEISRAPRNVRIVVNRKK